MNKINMDEKDKSYTCSVVDNTITIDIYDAIEKEISDLKYDNVIINIHSIDVFLLNINSLIKNITINVDSNCCVFLYNFNSNSNSYNIDANLSEKSELKIVTSTLSLGGANNIDIKVNHNGLESKSLCVNNGVIKDGNISYDVYGIVNKGAKNSDVSQESKIISSDISKASIKPILVIDDSVNNASHAASIGSYMDDVIFYMEARGIEKNEAIKLLNRALLLNQFKYASEIINLI